jgi:hypothetical protein
MTWYSEKAVGQYSGVKMLRGGAENCQYPGYYLQLDDTKMVQASTGSSCVCRRYLAL